MPTLFASERAIEILLALEQAGDGLALSHLAAILEVTASSVQKALALLLADELVHVDGRRRPRYRLAADDVGAIASLLDLALRHRPPERMLRVAARANLAVEFAGRDRTGLLLVLRWDAEPADEFRFERILRRCAADLVVDRIGHDDLRERLYEEPELRDLAALSEVLKGSLDRSFADPRRHGSASARPLGELHPALRRPSRRALSALAERFGLRRIVVFGSAVHEDFRPDSDVDLVVSRRRGSRRTLREAADLRRSFEDLLGRDVDVFDADLLRPAIRRRADEEGVAIYG